MFERLNLLNYKVSVQCELHSLYLRIRTLLSVGDFDQKEDVKDRTNLKWL